MSFSFNYAWEGLGDEITLDLSNGTHTYYAGIVMGTNYTLIDYLGGDVTANLNLWHGTTILQTAPRDFVFKNNQEPIVNLNYPAAGKIISGTYILEWTGLDPDNDQLHYTLEVNMDDKGWEILVAECGDCRLCLIAGVGCSVAGVEYWFSG